MFIFFFWVNRLFNRIWYGEQKHLISDIKNASVLPENTNSPKKFGKLKAHSMIAFTYTYTIKVTLSLERKVTFHRTEEIKDLRCDDITSQISTTRTDQHSLCLCPDFSVHDGCCGDAAGHGVNLKQATLTRRLNAVGHLTVLTLVNILRHNLTDTETLARDCRMNILKAYAKLFTAKPLPE